MKKTDLYERYKKDRDKYTLSIIKSNSPKKVIIAGPGTGKSYLFEKVCKKNISLGRKNNLTLSFINELVDDLAVDLHNLSEVKTLHSFARSKITGHDKYFLDLENIINKDYRIVYGKKIDFGEIFCRLIDDDKAIKFYSDRRKYYDHFSPISSVYLLVKFFKKNKANIPEYSQVLIDEFQDFNKLESTLIDLLAKKSPILIVGDDDQSLYGWKHANPEEIRAKRKSSDYESFELPYCSRCTRVIIDAFNCVVKQAKMKGLLKKRPGRPFKYFPSEEKDLISDQYPTISVRKKAYQSSEAYFIDTEIRKHVDPKNKNVSVLIICPFKKHIWPIEKMLQKKGYRNIYSRINKSKSDLVKGFDLLLQDSKCNLGWRIVSEEILNKEKFNQILRESYQKKDGGAFHKLIDLESRKYIKFLLSIIRKIKKGKKITKPELKEIIKCLNYDPHEITTHKIQQDMEKTIERKNTHRNIPIKITTIPGSKGLEGDYVFLVNFDERFIFENKGTDITDRVVCNFLVALTRTRKKLFIFSSTNKLPAFVNWLDKKINE
jgi:superfamily I DNA/RNA helicase